MHLRLLSLAATALALAGHVLSTPAPAPALTPTRTTPLKRTANKTDTGFVTIENGQFIRNDDTFRFVGTNAYWLSSLNDIQDINITLQSIKDAGLSVVRTWAFNDVDVIPQNGTWFQLIANGTTTINEGDTGLKKLDAVVELAREKDLLLILSLTNNWNPLPLIDGTQTEDTDVENALRRRDVTLGTNNSLLRNTLSNDYGGMDAYVRAFGSEKTHDEFYLNQSIVDIFMNYTTQIVSRYADAPSVLGWEIANDARCNSSLSASPVCNTTTVTAWHAQIADHIASIDSNHLVSSGTQGFACQDCPKLFPLTPAPSASAVATTKRWQKRHAKPVTNERILREEKERRKKTREARKRELLGEREGLRIRGRWIATRQSEPGISSSVGTAFDGSTGVDSQDILNIPSIGFGSFQLFPDQNDYSTSASGSDPNLPAFNNTVNEGVTWIQLQAELAAQVGKPTVMTAFGLVTSANAPFFVPFNTTIAPFNSTTTTTATPALSRRQSTSTGSASTNTSTYGVTSSEEDDAYTTWLSAAASASVAGAVQYQWGQDGLTTSADGSSVDENDDTSGTTANDNTTTSSPNDGYQSAPTDSDGVQSVLTDLSSLFG